MWYVANRRRPSLLVATVIVMIGWQVYVEFFAPVPVLRLIARYGLDKIIHFIGGVFLFLCAEALHIRRRAALALFIIAAATLWEVTELLFDADVTAFFIKDPAQWIRDTVGDYSAAFVGVFVAWSFLRPKSALNKKDARIISA